MKKYIIYKKIYKEILYKFISNSKRLIEFVSIYKK